MKQPLYSLCLYEKGNSNKMTNSTAAAQDTVGC